MPQPVNKMAVARAFGRAAPHYEQHAELQRLSGDALLTLAPAGFGPHLLDIGCGTGWYSRYWRDRGCRITALDLAFSSPRMVVFISIHEWGCKSHDRARDAVDV